MKVYKFNSNTDSYELQATINDDGTVDGNSPFANRIDHIFSRIEEEGAPRSETVDDVKTIVENRYNTGQYVTER
jgi:hypothetical protein